MIFVVDDDTSVRSALEDLLASIGLPIRSYGSTQEFLQDARPDAPSCLVLDVMMPGKSGLDFQRELADSNIQIPIIFITGHGDVPMSVRAMKAGAIEFLTKPFNDQELLDAIQRGLTKDDERRRDAAAVDAKLKYSAGSFRWPVAQNIDWVAGRVERLLASAVPMPEPARKKSSEPASVGLAAAVGTADHLEYPVA